MNKNKKNVNGFTLVELLSVVVILAIVTIIGIVAYNKVQKNRELKEQEALETNLKIQGKKYYMETGETIFYVQDLIDYGLIVPDDETGSSYGLVNDVRRPPSEFSRELRIRGRINCTRLIVDSNDDSIDYDATPHEKEDGSCEPKPTTDENLVIEMCTNTSCTTKTSFDPEKWYNSDVQLIARTGSNSVTLDSNNTTWAEKKNLLKSIGTGNTHDFPASKSGVNDYVVTTYIGDEEITAETTIKVDVVKPEITVVSKPTVINGNLEIKITDDKSGIAGYYISTSSTVPTTYTTDCQSNPCMEKTIKQKVDSYGTTTYYVWAIDNAGNKSSGNPSVSPDDPTKIEVTLDYGAPNMPTFKGYSDSTYKTSYNGAWTNKDVYIEITAGSTSPSDPGSNVLQYKYGYCNENKEFVGTVKTVDYSSVTQRLTNPISEEVSSTSTANLCLVACNKYGKCSKPYSSPVKIDKTPPKLKTTINPENLEYAVFRCIGSKDLDFTYTIKDNIETNYKCISGTSGLSEPFEMKTYNIKSINCNSSTKHCDITYLHPLEVDTASISSNRHKRIVSSMYEDALSGVASGGYVWDYAGSRYINCEKCEEDKLSQVPGRGGYNLVSTNTHFQGFIEDYYNREKNHYNQNGAGEDYLDWTCHPALGDCVYDWQDTVKDVAGNVGNHENLSTYSYTFTPVYIGG